MRTLYIFIMIIWYQIVCIYRILKIHITWYIYTNPQNKQATLRVSCSRPLGEPPQMPLVLFEKSAAWSKWWSDGCETGDFQTAHGFPWETAKSHGFRDTLFSKIMWNLIPDLWTALLETCLTNVDTTVQHGSAKSIMHMMWPSYEVSYFIRTWKYSIHISVHIVSSTLRNQPQWMQASNLGNCRRLNGWTAMVGTAMWLKNLWKNNDWFNLKPVNLELARRFSSSFLCPDPCQFWPSGVRSSETHRTEPPLSKSPSTAMQRPVAKKPHKGWIVGFLDRNLISSSLFWIFIMVLGKL